MGEDDWKKKKRRDKRDPFNIKYLIWRIMKDLMRKKGRPVTGVKIFMGPDGKPIIRELGNEADDMLEDELTIKINREPLVDIMEKNDEIIIIAETPGMKLTNLKLYCTKKELEIKAGRKFYKKLTLPVAVHPEELIAICKNRILEVRIPKNGASKETDVIA